MKKIITLLLCALVFNIGAQELVEIKPDSISFKSDFRQGLIKVTRNDTVVSQHQKSDKALISFINQQVNYPDATINILTPNGEGNVDLEFYIDKSKLNQGIKQVVIEANNTDYNLTENDFNKSDVIFIENSNSTTINLPSTTDIGYLSIFNLENKNLIIDGVVYNQSVISFINSNNNWKKL